MDRNLLWGNKDFLILREQDTLLGSGFTAMRELQAQSCKSSSEWIVIMVVMSGKADCMINGKSYLLRAQDMLLCLPNYKVSGTNKTKNFVSNSFCISRSLFQRAISFSFYNWDALTFLTENPVLTLTDTEFKCVSLYYSLAILKVEGNNGPNRNESLLCLLRSFLCDMQGILERYVPGKKVEYSQGRALFTRFLGLLDSVYPRPRSVSFYAEKLNVSTKYLSSVCKETSGHTASALINNEVTNDIADLLTYSNKSIKEIMVELDFPSLSFFGKYVKRNFGVGPKEYRAKQSS